MQVDMAEVLPFETERFGLINANLSMHYFNWKITEQIFSEIKRILKPKGILIGRVNSDKIEGYDIEHAKQLEEHYYYNENSGKYYRLFESTQWEVLTKGWKVKHLKEKEIIRKNNKKVLWEFILQK